MITFEVDQAIVRRESRLSSVALHKIEKALEDYLPGDIDGTVNLSFVDEAEIRRLNRMYRDKDKVTDVLSFPTDDLMMSGILGDVLICFTVAEAQAEGDLALELTDLIVHGTLHLLGYDHELAHEAEVMFPLQDKIVAASL